ncbi:hypothetical protein OKW29_002078 [Paraburkholderia sp. CI3]
MGNASTTTARSRSRRAGIGSRHRKRCRWQVRRAAGRLVSYQRLSPDLRQPANNVTPISRPKSRHEFIHRQIAVPTEISSTLQSGDAFPLSVVLSTKPDHIRFLSAGCEPGRTRHPSGSSMPQVCSRPGDYCRPRETLVPGDVQWLASQSRGCHFRDASQLWLIARAIRFFANSGAGAGARPISSPGCRPVTLLARLHTSTRQAKHRFTSNGWCSRNM